jgi:hypothetical protein
VSGCESFCESSALKQSKCLSTKRMDADEHEQRLAKTKGVRRVLVRAEGTPVRHE